MPAAEKNSSDPPREFVDALYKIGRDLDSSKIPVVTRARKTLARLRRGLIDDRYVGEAYELALDHGLPEKHERHGLLVAGLFALNPKTAPSADGRWRLCAALAEVGSSGAADARLRQLIAASQTGGLDYRLRQAVQLIGAVNSPLPLDYRQLLWDLICLDGGDGQARRVRLSWTRDFKYRMHQRQNSTEKAPRNA